MSPEPRRAKLDDGAAIARFCGHLVRSSVITFNPTDPPLYYWPEKVLSKEPGDNGIIVEDGSKVVG